MKELTPKFKERVVGGDARIDPHFREIPKDNKGITLIALIITIIVMMILVAVTVTFTIGENGIFNQAKQAVDKYKAAEILEQVEIAKISAYDSFKKDFFRNIYDNEEDFLENEQEAKEAGYIISGYTNMEKLYAELERIFAKEIEEGEINLSMINDFLSTSINQNSTWQEILDEMLQGDFTYSNVYQLSRDMEIWGEYLESKEWIGKDFNYIKSKANELLDEDSRVFPTDEDIQKLVDEDGDGELKIASYKVTRLVLGAVLHNYYIILEYNDEIYIIKSDDSSITSIKKDEYIPIEVAANEFDWIFEGDSDTDISIVGYKGNSTNIVIPEKIGGYTVVAIGGKNEETNNYYNVLSGGADTMISSTSIADINNGEDLTEDNWQDVKAILEDEEVLAYVFPDEVKDYATFVEHTKAYKKNGIFYIAVSMNISTGEVAFVGELPTVTVKLPKTVTTIYEASFLMSNIREINIPAAVTKIGRDAFQSCTSLEYVKFEEGRTTGLEIYNSAFENASSLKNINLPPISKIRDYAFRGCTSLSGEIKVNGFNGSGSLAYDVFRYTNLEKITFDGNITGLLSGAISNNSNLTEIVFEEGAKGLHLGTIKDNNNLKIVRIPKSMITSQLEAEYIQTIDFAGSHEELKVYIKTPDEWGDTEKQNAIDKIFKNATAQFIWE